MAGNRQSDGWVWVVVSNRGEGGHYLGLHSEQTDDDFIPAFVSREAAADCFLDLPRQRGETYEIQAVHLDELTADARKNGFVVALVDGDGRIIDHNGENL